MKRSFWYVVIGGLALSGTVAAASLNDWQYAASRRGCDSIPYDSMRSTCTAKSSEVEDWCKSRKSKCDDLDPSGISRKIENVKQKITDLKRERDELSSKIYSAKEDSERRDFEDKKKAKETEIYELEKKVETWQSDYASEQTLISERIYNGERCVGFRMEVQKLFSDAKSSARSETDPELKPYAEKLIGYWESEESGHTTVLNNYRTAVENCKSKK